MLKLDVPVSFSLLFQMLVDETSRWEKGFYYSRCSKQHEHQHFVPDPFATQGPAGQASRGPDGYYAHSSFLSQLGNPEL